jgi:hypothetical protein
LLGGPDAKEWLRQCGNVQALLSIAEDFGTGSLAWEVSKEVVDIYHQVSVRLPTCIRNQNPAASFRTRIMWVTPTPFSQ